MRPIALLLLCPALAAAQATPPAADPADSALVAARRAAEAAGRRTTRLFADQTPLSFTLTADFTTVFKDRDTLSTKRYPATLTVADSAGAPKTIPLEIAPRGHWRLKATNCPFPPIKLNLEDGTARGTPFQGQGGIKLGTHCRPGNREYEEYVLREHLVYRTYNLLTDVSLRTRLARVIYVWEKTSSPRADTAWALLIEDEDDAARRALGRIAELRRARFDDIDRAQMGLIGVFHYFTGNTDWSLYALHNLRLIQTVGHQLVPMAYDFDFSGIVDTRYATTDPTLPIKKVTERIYLGPCFSAAELETLLVRFREQRPAIEALYAGQQGLDAGYTRWVRSYIAEFYSSVGNERGVKRALIDSCVQESR
jgi:hypothetical protein